MRTFGLSVTAVFVAILVFPFAARALITVGALDIPGVTESVVVVDGIAYVAGGGTSDPGDSGLRVIDVSDPTAPIEIGAVNTPGNANMVVVVDGLAYVADRPNPPPFNSLRIIDVSDPAAPVEVGAIDMLNTVLDFAVADGFAYVLNLTISRRGVPEDFAFRVFDVSNPVAPVELDPIEFPAIEFPAIAHAVVVTNGLAYVASDSSGLLIIDVSNPAAPVEIGSFLTSGALGVTVVDGLAYLTGGFIRLQVIDVSNPAAPVELGGITGFDGIDVAVESGFPYLAHHTFGLRLADISNPAAPVELSGQLDPTSGTHDIAIAGGLAYVVGDTGLAVVDLSNTAFPAEIGVAESEGRAVAVQDGLAYTVGDLLLVIDVSIPTAPHELGAIRVNRGQDVAVAGGLAYVSSNDFSDPGLKIIDVLNPAAPFERGFVPFERAPESGVAVEGELAYLGNSRSSLLIVDASNPDAPVEIFRGTDGGGSAIEVVGGVAYAVRGSHLLLTDVSNPAAPVALGAIAAGSPRAVAVEDGLAYPVGDGLRVIDVSIPDAPVELGAIGTSDFAQGVAVDGSLAYVATGSSLRLIDVSNPAAPVELGGVGGSARDVAVVDGLVYVATGRDLRIIDFGPEYTGSIQIEIDIMPGGDPNSINPSLEGDLPVAILGSDSFDVADVDVATLTFGPSGASFDHSHGPHSEDLNGDGFTDLMAHFQVEETGIAFGDRMACISGETLDGAPFSGCDDVRTVPDMDGDALLDVEEATIGTHSLNPDTDGDGFDDGEEVLVMGTDPLDPLDPEPDPVPEPASWPMLVAGAAFLGVLYRRRARGLRIG
jgi:hypothetical protein